MVLGLNLYPVLTPCGTIPSLIAVVVTGWASFGLIDAVIGFYPPHDFLQGPPWSKVAFDVVIRHGTVHRFLTK